MDFYHAMTPERRLAFIEDSVEEMLAQQRTSRMRAAFGRAQRIKRLMATFERQRAAQVDQPPQDRPK